MYSSYRYRPDSVRINHKGRVLRRKTDYSVPDVEVIDANLMRKYSAVLTKQGYSVIPPGITPPEPVPEGFIEHDNSTQFSFTDSGNDKIVNNLGAFSTMMAALCVADDKRYCYKPFGLKFVNGEAATSYSTYATFKFQLGATSSECLYVIGKGSYNNTESDVICAWFIYDSLTQRSFIWFAGLENTSATDFAIDIDDTDVNAGYNTVQTVSEVLHPVFQMFDLGNASIVFQNRNYRTIQYIEQSLHSNKVYTSDKLVDPSEIP